jgi:hypothetical protein
MPNDNPILNNPYVEPRLHYATNVEGELDYEIKADGRRPFAGSTQSIPVAQKAQLHLIDHDTAAAASYGDHMVNVLRREVKAWRDAGYLNTTRVTRELLHFWFKNDQRPAELRLFFAQQEAIETAIFLNEVADKSNVGQRILRDLEEAQSLSGNLPRACFKMATGTGKTVVMGALIVYHFFNRLEYRGDVRFADNFLLVAPASPSATDWARYEWMRAVGQRRPIITTRGFWFPPHGGGRWAGSTRASSSSIITHSSRARSRATNARRSTARSDRTGRKSKERRTSGKSSADCSGSSAATGC